MCVSRVVWGFFLVNLTNFEVRQLLLIASQLGLTWVQEIQCSGWKNNFEKMIADMRLKAQGENSFAVALFFDVKYIVYNLILVIYSTLFMPLQG